MQTRSDRHLTVKSQQKCHEKAAQPVRAPPSYDAPPAYKAIHPSYDDVAPSVYNPAYSQPQAPPVSASTTPISTMSAGQAVPAQKIPVQAVPMGVAPGHVQTQVVYLIQNHDFATPTQATAQATAQATRPAQITTTRGEGKPGQVDKTYVQNKHDHFVQCVLHMQQLLDVLSTLFFIHDDRS